MQFNAAAALGGGRNWSRICVAATVLLAERCVSTADCGMKSTAARFPVGPSPLRWAVGVRDDGLLETPRPKQERPPAHQPSTRRAV